MLAALNIVAAFNGGLIGLVLLAQERFGPARTRVTLGCFLLTISALLALFVMLDTGRVTYSAWLGIAMDGAALLSAALLFDYVYCCTSGRALGVWPYAPAVLYTVAEMFHGERFGAPTDFRVIIAVQVLYSSTALVIFLRRRRSLPAGWIKRPEHWHLPVLLAGMGLLHTAQLLRLATPDSSFFFDLVPLVGAAGLLAFALYAVIGSQTLRSLAAPKPPTQDNDHLGHRLDAAMAQSQAYLDPDLSLPKAAALVGTPPQRLSIYLNAVRGVSFPGYVNALRIEAAKRLLRDPAEARTSIEAIAQLSGFRSRSSFYAAFQAQMDVSPQAYRSSGKSDV